MMFRWAMSDVFANEFLNVAPRNRKMVGPCATTSRCTRVDRADAYFRCTPKRGFSHMQSYMDNITRRLAAGTTTLALMAGLAGMAMADTAPHQRYRSAQSGQGQPPQLRRVPDTQDTLEIFIYALDPSVIGVRMATKYTTRRVCRRRTSKSYRPRRTPRWPVRASLVAVVPVSDVISVGVTDVIIDPSCRRRWVRWTCPQGGGN